MYFFSPCLGAVSGTLVYPRLLQTPAEKNPRDANASEFQNKTTQQKGINALLVIYRHEKKGHNLYNLLPVH
jgi:hypothetical protein